MSESERIRRAIDEPPVFDELMEEVRTLLASDKGCVTHDLAVRISCLSERVADVCRTIQDEMVSLREPPDYTLYTALTAIWNENRPRAFGLTEQPMTEADQERIFAMGQLKGMADVLIRHLERYNEGYRYASLAREIRSGMAQDPPSPIARFMLSLREKEQPHDMRLLAAELGIKQRDVAYMLNRLLYDRLIKLKPGDRSQSHFHLTAKGADLLRRDGDSQVLLNGHLGEIQGRLTDDEQCRSTRIEALIEEVTRDVLSRVQVDIAEPTEPPNYELSQALSLIGREQWRRANLMDPAERTIADVARLIMAGQLLGLMTLLRCHEQTHWVRYLLASTIHKVKEGLTAEPPTLTARLMLALRSGIKAIDEEFCRSLGSDRVEIFELLRQLSNYACLVELSHGDGRDEDLYYARLSPRGKELMQNS